MFNDPKKHHDQRGNERKLRDRDARPQTVASIIEIAAAADCDKQRIALRAPVRKSPRPALGCELARTRIRERVVLGQITRFRNVVDLVRDGRTFAGAVLDSVMKRRDALWLAQVRQINGELFDRGVEAFTWLSLEELARGAKAMSLHHSTKADRADAADAHL